MQHEKEVLSESTGLLVEVDSRSVQFHSSARNRHCTERPSVVFAGGHLAKRFALIANNDVEQRTPSGHQAVLSAAQAQSQSFRQPATDAARSSRSMLQEQHLRRTTKPI